MPAEHTKTERLDSQLLARLPWLHLKGAKLQSGLVHRRGRQLILLDAGANTWPCSTPLLRSSADGTPNSAVTW